MAGAHEDIVVCRKKTRRVELVRPPGTWLGARRDIARFAVDTILELQKGDLMVLYTDGVTEAMDAEERQFDIGRLCDTIEEAQDAPVAGVRDHVLAAVRRWTKEQHDDISLVAMRHHE
jgi:serine phosphatase RsbU (regulator of sigma subunit)